MQLTKAIFPLAGLGLRLFPATKAIPKAMLPIVDKPMIQYAVEEAIRAGFTHMIFIINADDKGIFNNHFTRYNDLPNLDEKLYSTEIKFSFIQQAKTNGLGASVLCAEQIVGAEPFALLLPDILLDERNLPCLASMHEYYQTNQQSIVAIQSVPWTEVERYGIVNINDDATNCATICSMREKPPMSEASSNLAIIGRYILNANIFTCLKQISPDQLGEYQLTDAIVKLLEIEAVKAFQYQGKHYDCGSKLGYLQSIVEFALQHKQIGNEFSIYLDAFHST